MCCGQKRTELRNSQASSKRQAIPQTLSANRPPQAVRTQPSGSPAAQKAPPNQPANTQTQNVPPPAAMTASTPHSLTSVRYLENSSIRVRGLVSGGSYEFSGTTPIQQVDARDASSLLKTRFFRRA